MRALKSLHLLDLYHAGSAVLDRNAGMLSVYWSCCHVLLSNPVAKYDLLKTLESGKIGTSSSDAVAIASQLLLLTWVTSWTSLWQHLERRTI